MSSFTIKTFKEASLKNRTNSTQSLILDNILSPEVGQKTWSPLNIKTTLQNWTESTTLAATPFGNASWDQSGNIQKTHILGLGKKYMINLPRIWNLCSVTILGLLLRKFMRLLRNCLGQYIGIGCVHNLRVMLKAHLIWSIWEFSQRIVLNGSSRSWLVAVTPYVLYRSVWRRNL